MKNLYKLVGKAVNVSMSRNSIFSFQDGPQITAIFWGTDWSAAGSDENLSCLLKFELTSEDRPPNPYFYVNPNSADFIGIELL